ncbi:thymidylate synthase [Pleomorphovibrio marinus]|uniref:thymidylate synthase n=1 Tax=Pleomorphovibrio marinus TaxID=2164132 RepID=UPI000E0B6BC6|nr:thymidylate synthase [Pleomorphovibrio marinus]
MLNRPTEFISLDDLLYVTYTNILKDGVEIDGKRGRFKELLNYSATLTNPRVRTSMSLHRSLVQSKFAEFAWFLSKSGDRDYIKPYISAYGREEQENNRILGAYGPKIFESENGQQSQFERVIEQILERKITKHAYMCISEKVDYKVRQKKHHSPPCTIGLHFYVRESKLNVTCYMRSNDAYLGLPHDLFCFTMLQELISIRTNIPIGNYTHCATSMHIYEEHHTSAYQYLYEGKQEPIEMPKIKEFNSETLNLVSKEFGTKTSKSYMNNLDDYWKDYVLFSKSYLNGSSDFESWLDKFSNTKMREIARNSIS